MATIPEPQTFASFWERLPENERIIADILRQIILENLPKGSREKFAYNVPCYYVKKRVCIIWPASVPRGGVREGVLLGFFQGYRMENVNGYIYNGTNKRVYYRIIKSVEEIEEREIIILLKEALEIDQEIKLRKERR